MRNQSQILEDLAGLDDARNCERATAPVVYLEDGTEKPLPCRWVVCPVCDGAGTHVNPSIDAGGLTAEDFADDPDFEEAYRSGAYNQTCNRCGGRTTVQEVDRDRVPLDLLKLYEQQIREQDESRAIQRAERMRGA